MRWCFLHNQFVGNGCNGCARDKATGVRRAPVKQPDGTWSDGVDRTHRISSEEYTVAKPHRVTAFRPSFVDDAFWKEHSPEQVWVACTGGKSDGWYPEFSDAIAAADKLARSMA